MIWNIWEASFCKIKLCPNILFWSFFPERAVANTMFASQMAVGYNNRHDFTISMANSRKRMGKHVTKGDFQKMYDGELSDDYDDEDF